MKQILKTTFLVVTTLTAFSSFGQELTNKAAETTDKKGYIGISLGPSFPIGKFASKDLNSDEAGFATSGAIFDISFAYKLGNGNFGITALLRGQYNDLDAQKIENDLNAGLTVDADGWSVGGLMVGGFGEFPISSKVTFDPRLMIGFMNTSSPEITISGNGDWIKQSSSDATSFAYLMGAGFKFNVGKKLYLLTNIDYLRSKPEFSDVEIIASDGTRDFTTWSQTISTINLSIGIALKI